MSIVRVGLAETKNFAEGYEAIFGKTSKSNGGKAKATGIKATAKKKRTKKK